MPFYYAAEEELSVVGIRCVVCDTFHIVAQGCAVPMCCWLDTHIRHYNGDAEALLVFPRLELHLMTCIQNARDCEADCRCPCHDYRPHARKKKKEVEE